MPRCVLPVAWKRKKSWSWVKKTRLSQSAHEMLFIVGLRPQVYPFAIVVMIGQRRIDVGQRHIVLVCDFIRGLTKALVPENDILDRDPMAGDPRLSIQHARRLHDVLFCILHPGLP